MILIKKYSTEVEIRRVKTVEEYKAVENIQRVIWGMIGESPAPVTLLTAINTNGGLVEIAKEGDKIIGFSLAFPGAEGNYRYLYSHMAGVLKEYRDRNIGYEIKRHQFEEARKMGYTEVRWTFDPMKTRNSFFNVHKLGAYAYGYRINYYGIMESEENQGVESDRIEAHKFLNREIVRSPHYEVAAKITDYPNPWEKIDFSGDSIGIEVPSDIGNSDIDLKRKWRNALRSAIISLEEKKYVMNDVVKNQRSVYLIFTLKEKVGLR
jgi:predicted GNAT superfamily acetyltransferase